MSDSDCTLIFKYARGLTGPLTVGSAVRGTILNYVIFIGHYLGQPIQQPIQMTSFRIVPRRTDPSVCATTPCSIQKVKHQ